MINFFRKSKPVSNVSSRHLEIQHKPYLSSRDYMKYFFDGTRKTEDLYIIIKKNVQALPHDELRRLAKEVLSVSFNFLRFSSGINIEFFREMPNLLSLHLAVVWHLSDSVHNIPSHLDEPGELASYVSEFFQFLHILNSMDDPLLSHSPVSIRYSFMDDMREWQHLYKE